MGSEEVPSRLGELLREISHSDSDGRISYKQFCELAALEPQVLEAGMNVASSVAPEGAKVEKTFEEVWT